MHKTYIIAEAGVNHNGSLKTAFDLCEAVKECGADAIKFQTWKTEKIITKFTEKATYQKKETAFEQSQFEMLKELELSYDEFEKIKNRCDKIGLQFLSTADEIESLDFLLTLDIPFIKIGSGEVTNIPYLRYISTKKKPVIMSTGMCTLSDVDVAVRTLLQAECKQITLLHCTTNYPCPYQDVNLTAMVTLKNVFQVPVGYSDHTCGIEIPISAVALGAEVIEKHITLQKTMVGPDHAASTEPTEFMNMVKSIRNVESAIGTGKKLPTENESEISKVVFKRILASTYIKYGEVLSERNLCVKRNTSGISAAYWDIILGTKAQKDYQPDEAIIL